MVFTSRDLLKKVIKALEDCPKIYNIVYYRELHRVNEDSECFNLSLEQLFQDYGKKLVPFETLIDYDLECKLNIYRVIKNPSSDCFHKL
jgi:hypothetical protein